MAHTVGAQSLAGQVERRISRGGVGQERASRIDVVPPLAELERRAEIELCPADLNVAGPVPTSTAWPRVRRTARPAARMV